MEVADIMKKIQHRYPFLLVDRIIELEPGKRAVGLKNVTINEWFFGGHFPNNPIMPGVLITEHAAQVSGILLMTTAGYEGKLAVITEIEGMKFRRRVIPGDQLKTEVTILRVSSRCGKVAIISRVGDEMVAEGKFTFMLATDPVLKQPKGKEICP